VTADLALIGGAAALGLASVPHCAAMCAAPCAAVAGRGAGQVWFQAARLAGYAGAGAVAAASVGAANALAQFSPALRPLWLLLHGALLVLGLWMLWAGRQPAWLGAAGRVPVAGGAVAVLGPRPRPVRAVRAVRAAAVGALWVAWPCGLLQSALLLASLTGHAAAGAAAMVGFAVLSSAGLLAGPWLWRRLAVREGVEPVLVRMAGALVALAALFALGHGAWQPLLAWCGLA
jgi:uncharacterized protein